MATVPPIPALIRTYPLLSELVRLGETTWFNPKRRPCATVWDRLELDARDIRDAAQRFGRFEAYLRRAFPETESTSGRIESRLIEIPAMQAALAGRAGRALPGRLLLKCDHQLPIAGSIKARGGLHEVFLHAEELAEQAGLLNRTDDYGALADDQFRRWFGTRALAVGSTGNLGLSIGLIGSRLGFRVTVHMSADAREWKKRLLRSLDVRVIEHGEDYSRAVAEGRRRAGADPFCHFVDDERSPALLLGYAVAAGELKQQLAELEIPIDASHPLFVYLPCGVGGGPGGVTFGLKQVFGDAVHCWFVEPTHAPCMLIGLCTGLHDQLSVQDFGIDNCTIADGLAVGRPSGFVGRLLQPLIDGVYTVTDESLLRHLALLADTEDVRVEPSAAAGLSGITRIADAARDQGHCALTDLLSHATHVAWSTGGRLVPEDEMDANIQIGRIHLGTPVGGA